MNSTTVLYIILAAIVALAIAVFQYYYNSKSRNSVIVLLTFLRFLGIFSIFLLLINPKIETQLLETVKPKLIVAVDNSSSIKYLKSEAKVADFLSSIENNTVLNTKFDISYFSFDEEVNQLDSLQFSKNSTNIRQTLESLTNLYKENATFLMVTDGNQTLGADYSFFKSNNTIFPIVVGDTVKREDLKISKINANKYAFVGNNFPVEIFVNYYGTNSITPVLTVKNGNTTVFRKNIKLNATNNSDQILFNLPASTVGVSNYTASLTYLAAEQNTINNSKSFSLEVINEQSKIAIVSAITHPDLGMLKRSIETNKQRKVTLLKPENATKLNDYQLVILYQPVSSFNAVFKAIEAANSNTFIISGSQTDWNFLNSVQQHFKKNVINQTENYLADININYGAFVLDDLDVVDFPPLQAYFGDITFDIPNETILFQNIDGFKTESPLLATYSYNDRRGAVLFGENSWKWRAVNYKNNQSFTNFDSFINKLVQYLSIKKITNQLELDYIPVVYQNDLVKIAASYFDNNYTIDNRVELVLELKNKSTNETKQFPFLLNKDNFETNLSDLQSGDYSFLVKVKGTDVVRGGNFTVLDYNIEQQFTYANVEGLNNIASSSGGKLYHLDGYQELLSNFEANNTFKPIQKSSKKTVSLLDWKLLLAIIIFFFSLEWFIRKYRGFI